MLKTIIIIIIFIRLSKEHPGETMVLIVDAAANGAYSQPHFHRHTKVFFKKYLSFQRFIMVYEQEEAGVQRQKVHLNAALAPGRGCFFYPMGEEFKSDPNVTVEIIERTIQEIALVEGRLPKRLILYLDNCARENKNKY